MNKTKIIATVGPVSNNKETLEKLIKNGVDVIRINLKHADYNFCLEVINNINELNKQLNTSVATMLDTKGPEVRIGKFIGGQAYLKKDSKIRVHMNEIVGDSTKFSVNYKGLINDVKYDTILKLDDGLIELKVLDKGVDYLLCQVLNGGFISDNKGMNIPDIHLNLPFLSKKDKEDIRFACKNNVDFLALSFVENAENVLEVNDLLINYGNDHIGIIAKIENSRAVEELDEIIKVSDGVMVARGDLGVELPLEKVPGIQKKIIKKCHETGKVSIVATEMLSTMANVNRPTRAEVSDVANAVLDGADAVMLSGETTIGKYPVETLITMEKIIKAAEEDINYLNHLDRTIKTENNDVTGILAYNVAETATLLNCKAIITPTVSGYTARKISRFRPNCPIIASTPNFETAKSLMLHFGVCPIIIEELKTFDKIIEHARKITVNNELIDINKGDKIIITGGYPFKEVKHTNFMKIEEL